MKVLITGAAGRLGHKLARALEPDYDLVLSDLAPLDDPRFVPLDVTDLAAARAAVRGCEAVVHMAILDWAPCSAEEELQYVSRAIEVHAVGAFNLLRAAWEAGIRRFVHISSVSAVDDIPPEVLVRSDTRQQSVDVYGMTKGFGEDVCRMFHHNLGLPVAVLRLGTIYNPVPEGAWLGNVLYREGKGLPPGPASSRVHVDDVTRAIALALETPISGYTLVHIVGADSGGRWDLEAARKAYGWEPTFAFGPDGLPPAR